MNIITWNVRGLGRSSKRFLLKDFFQIHCADICCIQESKLTKLPQSIWREIGGTRLDKLAFIPSHGSAGGMIICWDGSLLKRRVVHIGTFYLTVEFLHLKDNFHRLRTSVYGPNSRDLKQSFWNEIKLSNGSISLPWVICRDFNAIFSTKDKMSGLPNLVDIHNANVLMSDLSLLEPPIFSRRFTWTNGQSDPNWVRLNRFVVNSNWTLHFPKVIYWDIFGILDIFSYQRFDCIICIFLCIFRLDILGH